ncbi:FHA domain-containing protein [Methylobacillus arboreus]|uniref:FHA domain-containing protein n=1 Tax=Methylobacillus arboreus TaxID=755170 RepID=UPI001E490622|nr:FHA domain-containing protein [Methylobacillus arboreus]MCB5191292.1 FHA domain-containing protein [Methylobacillus arboreus]
MAKLVLTLEGDFLAEFPLGQQRLTIGRRSNCDIRLENLAVSGEHAAVVAVDDAFYIEDNQSTNGTMVNGQAITRHQLQDGDMIGLGRHQIEYREEDIAADRGFEKTVLVMPLINDMMARAAGSRVADAAGNSQPDVAANSPVPVAGGLAKVKVLSGTSNGRELVLTKTLTTLGRSGVQVAVITRRPHGYFLAHVEGEGRPVLNGHAVGLQAQVLANGDVIELAGVKMLFSLE